MKITITHVVEIDEANTSLSSIDRYYPPIDWETKTLVDSGQRVLKIDRGDGNIPARLLKEGDWIYHEDPYFNEILEGQITKIER